MGGLPRDDKDVCEPSSEAKGDALHLRRARRRHGRGQTAPRADAHLAVNQSVLLDEGNLSASSPDELAFVAAAEHFGFEFCARRDNEGELVRCSTSGWASFTLSRYSPSSRTSRHASACLSSSSCLRRFWRTSEEARPSGCTQRRRLDCSLLAARRFRGSDAASIEALTTRLGEWAEIALRTMVFAKRELPPDVFDAWYAKYDKAERVPPS